MALAYPAGCASRLTEQRSGTSADPLWLACCGGRRAAAEHAVGPRPNAFTIFRGDERGAQRLPEHLPVPVGRDSEDGAFWTAFLRSLKARGLTGTQLVISDAHAGLKIAIEAVLLGTSWQRSSADITTRRDVPVGHLRRRERTLAA